MTDKLFKVWTTHARKILLNDQGRLQQPLGPWTSPCPDRWDEHSYHPSSGLVYIWNSGQDWSSYKIQSYHRRSWILDETSREDTNTPPPPSELLPTQLLANNHDRLQCSPVHTQFQSKQTTHPTTFHEYMQQKQSGQLSLFHDMDVLIPEQELRQLFEQHKHVQVATDGGFAALATSA